MRAPREMQQHGVPFRMDRAFGERDELIVGLSFSLSPTARCELLERVRFRSWRSCQL